MTLININKLKERDSVELLLKRIAIEKEQVNRKDVLDNIEHYLSILTSVNLKYVLNNNYKLVYLIMDMLINNGVIIELSIIENIIPQLNLKTIMESNDNIDVNCINNILRLIQKNEGVNLNVNILFSLLFDAIILLIDTFHNIGIYNAEKEADFTLNQERENEEREDKQKSRKMTFSHANKEEIIEEESKEQIEKNDEAIKKRKKNDGGVEVIKINKKTVVSVISANDILRYANNIFNLHFHNFKILNDDKRIYAFFNNIFAIYCYINDYMLKTLGTTNYAVYVSRYEEQTKESGEESRRGDGKGEEEPFNFTDLYIFRSNLKRFIKMSINLIDLNLLKILYKEYMGQDVVMSIGYSLFKFSEMKKSFDSPLLEVMFINLNKISNVEPLVMYNFDKKTVISKVQLSKKKKEKFKFFFENDKYMNQKYKFLNILKIKGSLKVQATMSKFLMCKFPAASLPLVQTTMLLLILTPHFDLTIYHEGVRNTYRQLLHVEFQDNNRNSTNVVEESSKESVNNEISDEESECENTFHVESNKEPTFNKKSDIVVKKEQYKKYNKEKTKGDMKKKKLINRGTRKVKFTSVPSSSSIFMKDLKLNSDEEEFTNLHILIEYSRLIYKILSYVSAKYYIEKDYFLSGSLAHFLNYVFRCLTNFHFHHLKRMSLVKKQLHTEKYFGSFFQNDTENFETVYIKGKPHVMFYNSEDKVILSSYTNKEEKEEGGKEEGEETIHLYSTSANNDIINSYVNYLMLLYQYNLIFVVNLNVRLSKFILFSIIACIRSIRNAVDMNSMNIYYVSPIQSLNSRMLQNVLNMYIKTFNFEVFLQCILTYSCKGNLGAVKDIVFLMDSICLVTFKKNSILLMDRLSNILSFFIHMYKNGIEHLCDLSNKIQVEMNKRKGGNDDRMIVMNKYMEFDTSGNKCFNNYENSDVDTSELAEAYTILFTNIEVFEYLFVSFIKSINPNYVNDSLLTYIKQMLELYIKKKESILFYNNTLKGNIFLKIRCYTPYHSLFLYFYFNYSISKFIVYATLNSQMNEKNLNSFLHLASSLLKINLMNVEKIFVRSIQEQTTHLFFHLLQMVLKSLMFFMRFYEFRLMDKSELLYYLNQLVNIIKLNYMEENTPQLKKNISICIFIFFIYNYRYIWKIFDGNEEIENTYLNCIKFIFIDLNILRGDNNYDFLFDFYLAIREKEKMGQCFSALFTLHFVLLLKSFVDRFERCKRMYMIHYQIEKECDIKEEDIIRKMSELEQEDSTLSHSIKKDVHVDKKEKVYVKEYMYAIVEKNVEYEKNNEWHKIFNFSNKIKESDFLFNSCKNIMASIFFSFYSSPSIKDDDMFSVHLKEHSSYMNIELDIFIFSKFFLYFTNIKHIQDKLYIILNVILDKLNICSIFYEYVLINILLCFLRNFVVDKEISKNIDISIFIKLFFLVLKKEQDKIYSDENKLRLYSRGQFILKLLSHVFFIYINVQLEHDHENLDKRENVEEVENEEEVEKVKKVETVEKVEKVKETENSNEIKKELPEVNSKKEKIKACSIFFVRLFLLIDKLFCKKRIKINNDSVLPEKKIRKLFAHLKNYKRLNKRRENVKSVSVKKKENMLTKKMKRLLKKLLTPVENNDRKRANYSLLLELIEYVFLSFFIYPPNMQKYKKDEIYLLYKNSLSFFKDLNVLDRFDAVNYKQKELLLSAFVLCIYNINRKKKSTVDVTNESERVMLIHEKDNPHTEKDNPYTEKDNPYTEKEERCKLKINGHNLFLFMKLLLSLDDEGIHRFKINSMDDGEEENKKETVRRKVKENYSTGTTMYKVYYDFLFRYNTVLAISRKPSLLYIYLKYNSTIKYTFSLIEFSFEDVYKTLTLIHTEMKKLYEKKETDVKECCFLSIIHILTLIFMCSNNNSFLLHMIKLKDNLSIYLVFINLYYDFIKFAEFYLENSILFKNANSTFLYLYLIYRQSQLFTFFFAKLKVFSIDGSYMSFLPVAIAYSDILMKVMDLLKSSIAKNDIINSTNNESSNGFDNKKDGIDNKLKEPENSVMYTYSYILNNSHLFDKKVFYLYLLNHQLFTILQEFFIIRKDERTCDITHKYDEVSMRNGYNVKHLCVYLDAVLYLDNRINPTVMRKLKWLLGYMKSSVDELKLSKVFYPLLIKIIDVYDVILNKGILNNAQFEEKCLLKDIFQITLTLTEKECIQFCYSLCNEKKKRIFDHLSK